MTDHFDPPPWEHHEHQAIIHRHVHPHVTHNWNDRVGGYEHLSAEHDHEHDHEPLAHSHYPHEEFEREHRGEAHVHSHAEPVGEATKAQVDDAPAKKAPAKKAPAKKVAGTKKAAAG